MFGSFGGFLAAVIEQLLGWLKYCLTRNETCFVSRVATDVIRPAATKHKYRHLGQREGASLPGNWFPKPGVSVDEGWSASVSN